MNLEIIEDLKNNIEKSYNINAKLKFNFLQLIKNHPNTFYGRSEIEHITSSVLVIDETHQNVLLTHHKKFDKWLQLGGHWMDTPDTVETVFNGGMREVFEEAYGNKQVDFKSLNNGLPINLDIHPAGKDIHYDICYLVEVDSKIPYVISSESKDIKWISIEFILQNKEILDKRLVVMCEDTLKITESKLNKKKAIF